MFGGSNNSDILGAPNRHRWYSLGLSLAARVGAPNPANPDTGILTTAIPVGGEIGIDPIFGPGRDKWQINPDFGSLTPIIVAQQDMTGPDVYISTINLLPNPISFFSKGNIYVIVHNRGTVASGMLFIRLAHDLYEPGPYKGFFNGY